MSVLGCDTRLKAHLCLASLWFLCSYVFFACSILFGFLISMAGRRQGCLVIFHPHALDVTRLTGSETRGTKHFSRYRLLLSIRYWQDSARLAKQLHSYTCLKKSLGINTGSATKTNVILPHAPRKATLPSSTGEKLIPQKPLPWHPCEQESRTKAKDEETQELDIFCHNTGCSKKS